MSEYTLVHETRLGVSPRVAYEWHERAAALARLNPPWERYEILENPPIANGARVALDATLLGPIKGRWDLEYRGCIPARQIRLAQVGGPFESWEQVRVFRAQDDGGCTVEDTITYVVPRETSLLAEQIRNKVERIIQYQHAILAHDLAHPTDPLTIGVTGATGFVGSSLVSMLEAKGHRIKRFVRLRGTEDEDTVYWKPEREYVDLERLGGVDHVIHLAGENIFALRWTAEKKREILRSRVEGTRTLAKALTQLSSPPRSLICASAVGYYGDRGDDLLTEESAKGRGILADVTEQWEKAADDAREAGIRTAHLRIGVVLSPHGGALKMMLPPFQIGMGGPLGSGAQMMSWIAFEDLLRVVEHLVHTPHASGVFNAVSPSPVTNREFVTTLAKILGRPCAVPVPRMVLRALFKEVADEALLASQRVLPKRLEEIGYRFAFPDLEKALRFSLGRN